MATFERDCAGCNRRFTAKAANARWCSSGCKTRAQRVGKAAAKEAEPSRLVERLRADLEVKDASGSFEGLLAIEMAERLVKSGPAGFSTLARDLRVVRAAALGEELPTGGEAGEGADDPAISAPDPGFAKVLEIEERRDAKLAEASSAG